MSLVYIPSFAGLFILTYCFCTDVSLQEFIPIRTMFVGIPFFLVGSAVAIMLL